MPGLVICELRNGEPVKCKLKVQTAGIMRTRKCELLAVRKFETYWGLYCYTGSVEKRPDANCNFAAFFETQCIKQYMYQLYFIFIKFTPNQAHREGGVAGASAPGPGSPKGPSKKLSWCEKRWKRATRNREVKNCSSDTTCLQLPSEIQDLPCAAGWLSKVADRTKIRRKQRNKIILKGFSSELYPCTVLWF